MFLFFGEPHGVFINCGDRKRGFFRVKIAASEGGSEGRALYASLNKVDTDWFNRNDIMVNPNAHWSAHHLHLKLPLAGAEFVDD